MARPGKRTWIHRKRLIDCKAKCVCYKPVELDGELHVYEA